MNINGMIQADRHSNSTGMVWHSTIPLKMWPGDGGVNGGVQSKSTFMVVELGNRGIGKAPYTMDMR